MRVFVAGAGLMGSGIAMDIAKGHDVILYDISDQALKNAEKQISQISEIKNRVRYTQNIEDVKDCDLAIEAVFENIDIKSELLAKIEKIADKPIPICSNTSVICIDDIAERIAEKDRFLGLHWMNPPHVMPLVEIILSKYTSKQVVEFVKRFLEGVGKEVVICRNQSIVNRFNAAVLSEASKMVEEGVMVEDIDRVWKHHLGILYSLFGPLGNMDYIGLDVVYSASLYLYQRFRDEKFKPPEWLVERIDVGELGGKNREGHLQVC